MRKLWCSALVGLRRPAGRRLPRAWRTASPPRRCSSPAVSLRPPPRRPSTSPRSAPRWSPASPTTRSATSTGAPCRSWPSPASSAPSPERPSWSTSTADIAKPLVAAILLALGVYVTWRFLRPRRPASARSRRGRRPASSRRSAWSPARSTRSVAAAGVRSAPPSLLSSGRLEPRKVVGSIDTAEFVVTVGASLGFLLALAARASTGRSPRPCWSAASIAAPIAAIAGPHLAARVLGVAAGGADRADQPQDAGRGRSAPPASTVARAGVVVFTLWVALDRRTP